jgi:hypothetical protein
MDKDKVNTLYFSVVVSLVFMILAYFVYDSWTAALAIFVLNFLGGLTILIGIVPLAGVFLQYWIYTDYLLPFIFDLTGIYATWLTTTILAIDIFFGALFTFITTAAILSIKR